MSHKVNLELTQQDVLYSLLRPDWRREVAREIVWGSEETPITTRTDIERRLVGLFEQIAEELEQHS